MKLAQKAGKRTRFLRMEHYERYDGSDGLLVCWETTCVTCKGWFEVKHGASHMETERPELLHDKLPLRCPACRPRRNPKEATKPASHHTPVPE